MRTSGPGVVRTLLMAAVLVVGGGLAPSTHGAPPAAEPAPGKPDAAKQPGSLPPPPPGVEPDTGGETEGAELSEEDRLARRQARFREHLESAQRAQREEHWDEAVREYTLALQLQPGDPGALVGRAQSRKARTAPTKCPRRAINDLRMLSTYDPRGAWVEQRGVLVEWMGGCGAKHASERLALAQELANEDPGAPGRPNDIRFVVAQIRFEESQAAKAESEGAALRNAALQELERYRGECRDQEVNARLDAMQLQAKLYREADRLEDAIRVFNEVLVAPDLAKKNAGSVRRVIDELQFEVSLRELEKTQGGKPTKQAEAAYRAGVESFRGGNLSRAEQQLTEAVEESKWFPKAYYTRGVVRARLGRFTQAVEDLRRAIRLDRSDYQSHLTLGLLYKQEFGGAEDAEAIEHLERALLLRPDLHRLHLLLGELHARNNRAKAREHYERLRNLVPFDDPDAIRARQALDELERELREEEPPFVPPPPEESLRFLEPELQRLINKAYLRGTEHQDWKMAEKILMQARERFPDEPVVLNELAKVVYAQGAQGNARQYWEQSLVMKEDQMEVHERLGLLLEDDLPDEAVPHLRRAADLGSTTARYTLATVLWRGAKLFEASEQLDRYLAEAGPYDLHWDRANDLRETIDRWFLQIYVAGGLLLTLVIVWPAWRIYRRLRGSSLGQLLERDPKSFPEVARILSLIRHEILKHNTAFLTDVGRALEYDAPDADARLTILSRRLFGDPRGGQDPSRSAHGSQTGRRASELGGIYGRFLGYLTELEQVARNHGVTLNLYRKDPIFRPMITAFEELAERVNDLRSPDTIRRSKRLDLARVLTRAGHVLGRQAFERLSGLIRSLCVVKVDHALVAGVYERVAGEEQFQGKETRPLELRGSGAHVRIFRTDLEDILTNVLRNSLRSSVLYASPPIGLGVDLLAETDDITGLTSLVVRIKDRSPEQLSNEMLRGRYVERGMGITVDLLSRYDGSIGVEPEQGWQKAVVLRLFTLEADDVPAEAA